MAGLFDVAKELARLNKQRTKLQKVSIAHSNVRSNVPAKVLWGHVCHLPVTDGSKVWWVCMLDLAGVAHTGTQHHCCSFLKPSP
jgi:UDP-3-O-acyl-N-acetylglucosamine deacetylase